MHLSFVVRSSLSGDTIAHAPPIASHNTHYIMGLKDRDADFSFFFFLIYLYCLKYYRCPPSLTNDSPPPHCHLLPMWSFLCMVFFKVQGIANINKSSSHTQTCSAYIQTDCKPRKRLIFEKQCHLTPCLLSSFVLTRRECQASPQRVHACILLLYTAVPSGMAFAALLNGQLAMLRTAPDTRQSILASPPWECCFHWLNTAKQR